MIQICAPSGPTPSRNCASPTRPRSPGPGGYAVHLWLERLGTTGLTYGFRFCSADGAVTYAHGTRVLVRLDAATLRPAPWSETLRSAGRGLLRPAG
ncbi:hypothetical protein ALMP_66490 [Streptomyces sp. A012304]|nr:hypothetical protein ALMP_66490 [Streptomyces sp. A012304]